MAEQNPSHPKLETRSEWEQFFDWHAKRYDENPFTFNTLDEVNFLLALFPLPMGAKILDIGCGTGRHAIEFARRGFEVTGVDISSNMLEIARSKATDAGVIVNWVKADATEYVAPEPHDFAYCVCEGAFNLAGKTEDPLTHDIAILRNASDSLKPRAPFVLNALNGFQFVRHLKDEAIENHNFDPVTMIATYEDVWNLPEGPTPIAVRERLYFPSEISAMLHSVGFKLLALYGGTAGDWKKRPLKLDEVEAMYVCQKK